jgi:hypothetical protein
MALWGFLVWSVYVRVDLGFIFTVYLVGPRFLAASFKLI